MEFKLQALELSDEIGVKAAAEQLGIKYYTLADWRSERNVCSPECERDRLLQIQKESQQTRQGCCSFGSYAGCAR